MSALSEMCVTPNRVGWLGHGLINRDQRRRDDYHRPDRSHDGFPELPHTLRQARWFLN